MILKLVHQLQPFFLSLFLWLCTRKLILITFLRMIQAYNGYWSLLILCFLRILYVNKDCCTCNTYILALAYRYSCFCQTAFVHYSYTFKSHTSTVIYSSEFLCVCVTKRQTDIATLWLNWPFQCNSVYAGKSSPIRYGCDDDCLHGEALLDTSHIQWLRDSCLETFESD